MIDESFRAKKYDRHFDLYDTNGDGVLELADYLGHAERILRSYRESPRSRRGKAVVNGYRDLWEVHRRGIDTNADNQITREEFRTAMERNVLGTTTFFDVHQPLIRAILNLIGSAERGVLNITEFKRLMSHFGVSGTEAEVAFSDLDSNGDERLTYDEIVAAVRDFYLSADPDAPGNTVFGWT